MLRIFFKHMPSSAATTAYAEQKLGERLDKYRLEIVEAHLTVAVENGEYRAICHVVAAHDVTMTVSGVDTMSMNAAIDRVADRIDARLKRKKEKLQSHRGHGTKPAVELAQKIAAEAQVADAIDAEDILRLEKCRPHATKTSSLALFGAAFLAIGAVPAQAQGEQAGELVVVDATQVFVPIGFDDNDEAELVLDGYLPNGCHRVVPPQVTIDATAKRIEIVPKARQFPGPCLPVVVPYTFEVQLGQLDAASYAISVRGASLSLNETLPVYRAIGPGPDDFTYAPVDDVQIGTDPTTGALTASIWGRITNKCMRWDHAVTQDHGKTVNILPIVAFDGDLTAPECRRIEMRYKKVVPLPETMTSGRHLLHVRSMNGDAFNRLFHKK